VQVTPEILKKRTFQFALDTLNFVESLKHSTANDIMGKQVMRAASSVGANYRAACRAKSGPDFINKLKIVEEESDETSYWFELIQAHNKIESEQLKHLIKESFELDRIFASSVITAKNNLKTPGFNK